MKKIYFACENFVFLFSKIFPSKSSKVRKTRLQADFVTNNQTLVVKIMKIRPLLLFRPSRLLDFMNFYDPSPPRLLRPPRLFGT